MTYTLYQANKAREYSDEAKKALRTFQMVAISERLKSAQEHIRDIAPEKVGRRGFDAGRYVDAIRREFDQALSALPKSGVGSDARGMLTNAQTQLNDYQKSLSGEPLQQAWSGMQILVQDAISALGVEVELGGRKK